MLSRLIEFSLKHRLLIVLVFIGISAAGVFSLSKLQIDAFPDISPNLVQVFAELDGMAPEEVEQFVTRPVEIAMRGIPGVTKIRSISSLGLSTVNIYFDEDTDIDTARQYVSERIKEARESIPENMNLPHGLEMGPIASGMGKVLGYYIKGDGYTTTQLRTIQEWIVKRDIQTVGGIAKVISQGGYVRQYQVRINPAKLVEYDLTLDDIIRTVNDNNTNLGAGIIERGSEELIVRSIGLAKSLEDIENMVVSTDQGSPIFIKDVADVKFGNAFRRGVSFLDDGKEVVLGSVYKLYGANSFQVIEGLKERIAEISNTLPEGVEIVPYYDQSSLVKNSINTVKGALGLGLILVCLVSFLFLGHLRNALVVVCSLPFSMLFAFILMYRNDMPGDLISFGGISIALGMIVDATIIMVEKIHTSVQALNSKPLDEKILNAAKEVAQPIFFASIIIIIVFIPIFTLGEVEGKMFRPLAFAVSTTIVGALIYALLIAPVFYRLLHKKNASKRKYQQHYVVVLKHYKSILQFFLVRRQLVIYAMIIMVALGVFTFANLGREFMPSLQEGSVQILAYMNPNISLEEISETTKQMVADVSTLSPVEQAVADIGFGEVGPHMHHTNYACITVTLKPKKEWRDIKTQQQLIEMIDHRIGNYPGVNVSFSQPIKHEVDGLIAGAGTAVVAKVFGHDMDVLLRKAAEINETLSHIEGVADLRTEQVAGQTQLQIDVDRALIARHGLNNSEIQRTVQAAIAGRQAGVVYEGDKVFGINVRFAEDYRSDIDSIKNLLIKTPKGYNVPLADVSDIDEVTGLRQVSREDTQRYISVQCNVRGTDAGGFVKKAQKLVAENVTLPSGYRVDWGGQFELQQAANKRLALVVPVTLFLVLIMLYGLFNSFKNVFLILLNIPLALVGGVFALALFKENISIPSSIGFIALFGIALTDGLVLVSRFEHLRKQGVHLRQAVIDGCISKLRPVLMTSITTALGLLPLIFATGTGSEIQKPLAIVVVGGLFSSTILTLIVIPTLYEWTTLKFEKTME